MEFIGARGTIIVGKVVENTEGTGAGAGKVRNIKLEVNVNGGKKLVSVAFWNNENTNLADRANVISVDSYLMVYCTVKEGKYTGYSFAFPGNSIDIEVEGETDNIRQITLSRLYKNTSASGKTYYGTKIKKYDAENKEVKEIPLFVNFSAKIKERAEKVLASDISTVALVSFPIETSVVNDKESNSIVAFSFERLD